MVNIVSGGDDLGAWMTSHPVPRKISFTGSVETGKKVALSAAPDLKRVTLELGGNDPAIVLDDADPAAVATAIFAGAFNNNGQVCSAIKRVYVPEALYDDVVEGLAAHARSIKVGEGTEDGVKLGPINNEPQYERVKELVADALSHGATAVTGGKAMDRPGYFFEPTILTGLSDGTRIVDEEQFGPALPVVPYRDLGDAIDRANATHFGLSGSVWGADADRAAAVAAQLECGTAWVNTHLGAGSAAALRRLQVERHRRGERSLGPGRVLRVPGRPPLQGGQRAERQHRDAAVVAAAAGVARARGQPVVVVVVAASPARAPFRSCTICLTSARPFCSAPAAAWSEDFDACQQRMVGVPLRRREGQHRGGESVGRVGRGADLAVEVVDQRLQVAWLAGVTRACALAASAVRFGMAVVVAWSASAAIRAAGSTSTVDAVVAEDRPEVVGRLLHRAVTLNRLVELLQRRDVGAEVRHQGRLARAEALGRVDLGDRRVEAR